MARNNFKRAIVLLSGVILIIIGIIGLFLPFLQGFVFLFVGLAAFSLASQNVHNWLEEKAKNQPKILNLIKKVEDWIRKIVGEM